MKAHLAWNPLRPPTWPPTWPFMSMWLACAGCGASPESGHQRGVWCTASLGWSYIIYIWSAHTYCWWKKSCTSWNVLNPVHYEINYRSTGAGFLSSIVCHNWSAKRPYSSDSLRSSYYIRWRIRSEIRFHHFFRRVFSQDLRLESSLAVWPRCFYI